jgi:carboxypeptidase Taq
MSYPELFELSKEVKTLQGIGRLLEWDQETHMPPGAAPIRAEQLKVLSGLSHELFTSKKFRDALARLIDLDTGDFKQDLSPEKKSAVKEWRRDFLIATKLPKAFVEKMALLTSESIMVWAEARRENKFNLFAPYLEKLIDYSFEKARYLGCEKNPYDALLDHYEPDLKEKDVDGIFSKLKVEIKQLLTKIQEAPQVDSSFLEGDFDHQKQLAFSKEVLTSMGYDFSHGRMDISTHPFSTSFHPTDSRITTRMYTKNILDCILATIHEGGHSLYEMGLPVEHFGSPLCEAVSLGVHESQSRFWETRIGQSKPFWSCFLPKLQQLFPIEASLEEFWKAVNKVQPTFIRVEADEVTYPLHVILRFEIEKGFFNGSIQVKDLPHVWREKMHELLGITPTTDTQGCLQDIHWSMGAFGYFPTYTLGNLYAAHIFLAFEKDFPDWEKKVASGDLSFIRNWLKEKVHQHGRRYTSHELLQKIHTGTFSEKPYIDYLNKKYSQIYK